ncbi:type VI secretion system contractile sheath small subunit [Methylobacterium indicum]|uniref:type VI secretion system contractile sheath small subunit n=1 Tax=Methylobacterium indicum TaxID=1775910 RepID=UPI002435F20A|nr:type VI secretion system contractile sheath small subunit [Methylobacterium indicum]
MASIHEKLERVRKPRVHIKYEVETEGALIEKELPFVVGVLGDFTGDPSRPLKPFRERKFIQIDRDNFDEVMARMAPGLNLVVDNTLADDGTQMPVRLHFDRLDDFEPAAIVRQVPALATLLETRDALRDLMTKADRSEDLELLLERILQDNGQLRRLVDELERTGASGPIPPTKPAPTSDGAA